MTSAAVVARSRERELALIELPESAHLSEVLTGTLEALVSAQATELRRAAAVRDRLGDLVLAGVGLEDLPDVIAELAAGEVAVVSAEAQVLGRLRRRGA